MTSEINIAEDLMNIGSLIPPVNTTKLKQPKRSEIAVAGSEIGKEPHRQAPVQAKEDDQQEHQGQERREKGKDRRQRNIKPLVDMRSGSDRRKDKIRPSINVDV